MKRRKVDARIESRIVTAMIASKEFLSQAYKVADPNLFAADHVKKVVQWCLDYFNEYEDAPRAHIEDIYRAWSGHEDNEDVDTAIHDLLETLSDTYEEEQDLNVPYLVDQLAALMNRRIASKVLEDAADQMTRGDHEAVDETLRNYRKVEIGAGAGFDPLNDDSLWDVAYDENQQTLFTMGGAAGVFFDPVLTRDSLLGIQAAEKTGKTWWCIEFLHRALRARRKVAFFQVGDLSKNQVLKRLGVRLSGRPMWGTQCGAIRIPKSIEIDDDEECGYRVLDRTVQITETVSPQTVRNAIKKFKRAVGLPKNKKYLKVSVHSSGSINIKGISGILDQWEADENFIADVIIIDYADILAPEDNKEQESRDKINQTWLSARRLSQDRHALVIFPTQADAGAYSQEMRLQTMRNFSNDKRKYAHVTGMVGLNQTPAEKEMGGMRANWIVLREAPFNIKRPLYVGTCLQLGRALCCSAL